MEVVEKEVKLRELREVPDRRGNRTPQIIHIQPQLCDVQLAPTAGRRQPVAADADASAWVGARRRVRLPPRAARGSVKFGPRCTLRRRQSSRAARACGNSLAQMDLLRAIEIFTSGLTFPKLICREGNQ